MITQPVKINDSIEIHFSLPSPHIRLFKLITQQAVDYVNDNYLNYDGFYMAETNNKLNENNRN